MNESSRKQFIKKLFEISNDNTILDSLSRYRKMGLECKLEQYLNGHATNFVQDEVNKPPFPPNGFVALNVEVSASDSKMSPIIPFFSISIDGKKDRKKDREFVLSQSGAANKKGFLTCPKFMNRTGLEKVLFKVPIQNNSINPEDVKILKYSLFNEAATPEYGAPEYDRFAEDSLMAQIRSKRIEDTFIYSWCAPFLQMGQTLYCNVRAVDRDHRYRSHSIFVTIFFEEEEIKKWVGAYGEDLMNIITIVKSIFIDDIHETQLSESIKSAVSAIMSRNMSHNLGSHYLYYTKAHLESLANKSEEKGPDIRGAAKVLEYLQSRMDFLATIISNEKHPYLPVLFKPQIYDELTIDDFSKRHFQDDDEKNRRTTNFLLSNLIISENFTRSDIYVKDTKPAGNRMPLLLQVMLWDENQYKVFTGTSITNEDAAIVAGRKSIPIDSIATIEKEADIKNKLSKLNVALPGGARHAFFTVLENFIRNSAKNLPQDIQKDEGLVITIAIRRNIGDDSKFDFIIFDNKKNANRKLSTNEGSKTVINNLIDQLANLRVLDKDNGVERSSQGLKEMLFSSVWMRAYMYPESSFADVINRIHSERKKRSKLELISKYGFSIVPVASNGLISTKSAKDANLGVVFTLPEFKSIASFDVSKSGSDNTYIAKSLDIYADIIEFERDTAKKSIAGKSYVDFFPRTYLKESFNEADFGSFVKNAMVVAPPNAFSQVVYKFKSILDQRFKYEIDALQKANEDDQQTQLFSENCDIDSFQLLFGGDVFEGYGYADENRQIYFKRHLNSQDNLSDYKGHAYADTISGGNFTITLYSLVKQGLNDDGMYLTWEDKYFGLKVKESALTRITLIDERLYNNMVDLGENRRLELQLKNIRVLNYVPSAKTRYKRVSELFEGSAFKDGLNRTHFLSIHLGIIEKIIKNDAVAKSFSWGSLSLEERVNRLMLQLSEDFSCQGTKVFITIHSGRGNISKELEGPLSNYPFISLSAIDHEFNDSKYLLSQLFYNMVYTGKRRISKKRIR